MVEQNPIKMKWWELPLLVTLLLIFSAIALTASLQKSASFDEQYHLAAGYAYLKTADFRLSTTHPPLIDLFAATALLGNDVMLPLDNAAWDNGDIFKFSEVFLWQSNANSQGMLVAARQPIILLATLLLVVIWLWTRQLWGRWAGWIALFLAMLDPNLLANGRLITTDLGVTALIFFAMWRLWHWQKWPSFRNLIFTGLLAGLAMAAKYTGLLFWPIAIIVLLSDTGNKTRWQRVIALVGIGMVALFTLTAVFRFDVGSVAALPFDLPLPAPFYWQNLWTTFVKLPGESASKLNFLLGDVSLGGWWYYFPVALVTKTPLPTLILLVMGIVHLGISTNSPLHRRSLTAVILPPLAFLLLGMTGILTIGYRHLLPALPFLIMIAGYGGAALLAKKSTWTTAAITALLLWTAISASRIYPHQEAYFNELAGDWQNWSNILVDSNLDWGQDLIALRELMYEYGIEEVNLAYFGMAYPEKYGIQYRPLPGYLLFVNDAETAAYNPYTPAPGWYAISATSLRLGTLSPETADYYSYFQEMEPIAHAGYSIYLYNVPDNPAQPITRVVVNETAVGLHSREELDIQSGQRTIAKWSIAPTQPIYPQGDGFTADYTPINADFDGVMTLLGVEINETTINAGNPLPITLYWQVGERPMPAPAPLAGAPLAAFLHLTGEEAWQIAAQYGGWETALRGLETGDIISQKAIIWVDDGVSAGNYNLLVGLYSPQTMERLQPETAVSGENFIRLSNVQVTHSK